MRWFFLLVLLGAPAWADVSHPSSWFKSELDLWGIQTDDVFQIEFDGFVSEPYSRTVLGLGPDVIREAFFRISEANVAQVAQRLAIGYDAAELEAGLRQNLRKGYSRVPLVPFLPPSVKAIFGTRDERTCYYAGFNFNEMASTVFSQGNDRILNVTEVWKRYSDLGYQDKLRYGDIILIRGHADTFENSKAFHVAVYIGGDVIYHKFSPLDAFHYEFSTMESLFATYGSPAVGVIQQAMGWESSFRAGNPFFMQFLRYDPHKTMPPPRRKPPEQRFTVPTEIVRGEPLCATPIKLQASSAPNRSLTGRVGRNDPCPCASGRKYKKCCGR
jgi:hypothetical protein